MKKSILFFGLLLLASAPVRAEQDWATSPGDWEPRLDTFDKDAEDRLTVKEWNTGSDKTKAAASPAATDKADVPPVSGTQESTPAVDTVPLISDEKAVPAADTPANMPDSFRQKTTP